MPDTASHVVFPYRFLYHRIHGSSAVHSWNSQLLPQGDAVSGLLPGIDRRVTAAGVTGARGYDIVIVSSRIITGRGRGCLWGGSAGRGQRDAGCNYRPATLPPVVAQFPDESRAVRSRRDATPSHFR
ncbi:unnamed protein product [Euphydryas editha]|uniref:Uncharacterized protein n=1 Tax=Euphydryas editha TaxID=104508 RepID=A0AAU9V2N3_EUPED|nr:unnamed protein product [Euphydryas editha]